MVMVMERVCLGGGKLTCSNKAYECCLQEGGLEKLDGLLSVFTAPSSRAVLADGGASADLAKTADNLASQVAGEFFRYHSPH